MAEQGMLAGKVALVTGAASGIGRETAILMAREGAKVLAADRNGEGAIATAGLIGQTGGTARAFTVDVADEAAVEAMVADAVTAWGRLDCAFNNAGIAGANVDAAGKRVGDVSRAAWDGMLAVNLTGVWLCMRHELARMEAQGGGAIVNTASIAGLVGLPGSGAYVVSKHGVIALTKNGAIDYASVGIRVNAVCPGYIETPMVAEAMARRGEQIVANTAFKRLGKPIDIAEAVVWLCSDRAAYVTGTALTVDGGYTAL